MQGSGHGSGGGVIAGGVGLVRLRLGDGALQVADGALLIGAVFAGDPLVLHGVKGGTGRDGQFKIFHAFVLAVPDNGGGGAGSNGVDMAIVHIAERFTSHGDGTVFILDDSGILVVGEGAVVRRNKIVLQSKLIISGLVHIEVDAIGNFHGRIVSVISFIKNGVAVCRAAGTTDCGEVARCKAQGGIRVGRCIVTKTAIAVTACGCAGYRCSVAANCSKFACNAGSVTISVESVAARCRTSVRTCVAALCQKSYMIHLKTGTSTIENSTATTRDVRTT